MVSGTPCPLTNKYGDEKVRGAMASKPKGAMIDAGKFFSLRGSNLDKALDLVATQALYPDAGIWAMKPNIEAVIRVFRLEFCPCGWN